MRELNFSDGFEQSEQPTTTSIPAGTQLMRFPSVEAFLANKGTSEAESGDQFYNTTEDRKFYFDVDSWQQVANLVDIGLLEAEKEDKVVVAALEERVSTAETNINDLTTTVGEHSEAITELGGELDGLEGADHEWTGSNKFDQGISIGVAAVNPAATEINATAPLIKLTGTVTTITNLKVTGLVLTVGLQGILKNDTDHDVIIQHNAGATDYKFNTGAGKDIKLKKGAALLWCFENNLINIVGGSGSGGNYEIDAIVHTLTYTATVQINDDGFKILKVKGDGTANAWIGDNGNQIISSLTNSTDGLIDSQVVTLVGSDDANPLTVKAGPEMLINGDTILYNNETLTLLRINSKWVYLSGKVGT